jgi:hypothetical protein
MLSSPVLSNLFHCPSAFILARNMFEIGVARN